MKIQYILLTVILIILNIPLYSKIKKTMFPKKGELKNSIIQMLYSDDTTTRTYWAGRPTATSAEYFFGIVIAILVLELGVLYWARHIYMFYN